MQPLEGEVVSLLKMLRIADIVNVTVELVHNPNEPVRIADEIAGVITLEGELLPPAAPGLIWDADGAPAVAQNAVPYGTGWHDKTPEQILTNVNELLASPPNFRCVVVPVVPPIEYPLLDSFRYSLASHFQVPLRRVPQFAVGMDTRAVTVEIEDEPKALTSGR